MDKTQQIEDKLFALPVEKYGDKYIEHLLEQYKIYVESAEKISDRRQKNNEFFLGLNTALVALLGFALSILDAGKICYVFLLASVAGIFICYYWHKIILSYKGLNSGKFEVIHLIEKRMPLALYDTEWEILGRGEDKKKYNPFSHIELKIPGVFIAIYVILFLVNMPYNIIYDYVLALLKVMKFQ
jgi:hypothetical protein